MYPSSKYIRGPPPQARGRRLGIMATVAEVGTTPAGAGTTPGRRPATPGPGDHPRRRGDDLEAAEVAATLPGPPPQARGRLPPGSRPRGCAGTTPAGAGTTMRGARTQLRTRDHPRRRGDDIASRTLSSAGWGPPPQARGRPLHPRVGVVAVGTTPAGAGTTRPRRRQTAWRCGPPPQARGRLVVGEDHVIVGGTTPAGAGTTTRLVRRSSSRRDHPRRRGDDVLREHRHDPVRGTTPAGAGTTRWPGRVARRRWDHPRRRGDDTS
ncbi:hypothetical protein SAMN05443637_12145 [Pseudonocardia thermophila]|uniref:Uncharacterized protein n=1 Tax=Pseudonocardia thermophila TaxID=1848 RepID=A0A1M6YSY5_PSETH|nr:hypothetical protein SAMN05443637_12145 [Pseudonocardia thermophila]